MGVFNSLGNMLIIAADTIDAIHKTSRNNRSYSRSYSGSYSESYPKNNSGLFEVITDRDDLRVWVEKVEIVHEDYFRAVVKLQNMNHTEYCEYDFSYLTGTWTYMVDHGEWKDLNDSILPLYIFVGICHNNFYLSHHRSLRD